MYRFQVDIHHAYVWTPTTQRLTLIYKEESFDLSALSNASRARYFCLLVAARERESGDRRSLCKAFIQLFALVFGTRELALESIAIVRRLGYEGVSSVENWESLGKTAQSFVDDVFIRGSRVLP